MGAQLMCEVASKSADAAREGTTSNVPSPGMRKEGAYSVACRREPMDLRRGVDVAIEAVVANLQNNSNNGHPERGDRGCRHHLGHA